MIKYLAAVAVLFLAMPALASDWRAVQDDGSIGDATQSVQTAVPGRTYKAVLTATTSHVINVRDCPTWKLIGEVVSTTFKVQQCESGACNAPVDHDTSTFADEEWAFGNTATPAVQVYAGTVGDEFYLACGPASSQN